VVDAGAAAVRNGVLSPHDAVVDDAIAHRAAGIGPRLRLQGRRLSLANLLVAATAVERGLTLVTHSAQTFAGIPGLVLEDWTVP
jgi:predicted nucleic acid-binding protein